jgi:hypothetical protein
MTTMEYAIQKIDEFYNRLVAQHGRQHAEGYMDAAESDEFGWANDAPNSNNPDYVKGFSAYRTLYASGALLPDN